MYPTRGERFSAFARAFHQAPTAPEGSAESDENRYATMAADSLGISSIAANFARSAYSKPASA